MTFRLSRMAYAIVVLLVFCVVPFSLTKGAGSLKDGTTTTPVVTWRIVFLVIPVLAAVFIARWATTVDATGIRIRALFGSRKLSWDEVRGLSIEERSVFAVVADGEVRLPCVHVNDLARFSRASGGRMPEVAPPRLKFALSRRPRGRRRTQ